MWKFTIKLKKFHSLISQQLSISKSSSILQVFHVNHLEPNYSKRRPLNINKIASMFRVPASQYHYEPLVTMYENKNQTNICLFIENIPCNKTFVNHTIIINDQCTQNPESSTDTIMMKQMLPKYLQKHCSQQIS